jgi:hypothetical protein
MVYLDICGRRTEDGVHRFDAVTTLTDRESVGHIEWLPTSEGFLENWSFGYVLVFVMKYPARALTWWTADS